jgi:uncharacterized protein YjbJ (UPF0337 family)
MKKETQLTRGNQAERTVGGLAGKVIGQAKEALGAVTDRDDLAREGRRRASRGHEARVDEKIRSL